MYTSFAGVYDKLMSDVDYSAWAEYYSKLIKLKKADAVSITECACGTGNLSVQLYNMGYSITGIDLSLEMLEKAACKARENACRVIFSCQDMTKFKIHKPVDAIIAGCDGVNYLLENEDIKGFFTSAYNALIKGGVLAFDVSTPYKLKNILASHLWGEDTKDITYIWQNYYNDKSKKLDMQLAIFVLDKDGKYTRIDEEQTQKALEISEYKRLLQECGFTDISVFGDQNFCEPNDKEKRWHFAAVKK